MKRTLLWVGLCLWASLAQAADPAPSCKQRYEELTPLVMRMPYREFDQSEAGWRKLSDCPAEAASLLKRYLARTEYEARNLRWHLSQTLAMAGDTAAAITAAEQSRDPPDVERSTQFRWNVYVDGTLAFLRRDRTAFDKQREALRNAAVAHPENLSNLAVLDRLATCFERPYKQAYVCTDGR